MIIFDANRSNYTRLTSNRHDVRIFLFGLALGLFLGSLTFSIVFNRSHQAQLDALVNQIARVQQERDTALDVHETSSAATATCEAELKTLKKEPKVPLPKPRPQAKAPAPTPPPMKSEGKLLKVGDTAEIATGFRVSLVGISRHASSAFCFVVGNNIPDGTRIPAGGTITIKNIDQNFILSANLESEETCRIALQR